MTDNMSIDNNDHPFDIEIDRDPSNQVDTSNKNISATSGVRYLI